MPKSDWAPRSQCSSDGGPWSARLSSAPLSSLGCLVEAGPSEDRRQLCSVLSSKEGHLWGSGGAFCGGSPSSGGASGPSLDLMLARACHFSGLSDLHCVSQGNDSCACDGFSDISAGAVSAVTVLVLKSIARCISAVILPHVAGSS